MSEYSTRLQDRLKKPEYLTDESEKTTFIEAELPGKFCSEIGLPENRTITIFGLVDKNQPECPITDMKFYCDFKDEKMAFIDAMLKLCIGRHDQTLEQFSLREVENFLRDSNETPSLPGNGASFYPFFSKIIEGLKNAIAESRGRRPGVQASPTIADDYRPDETPIFDPAKEGAFDELTILKKNLVLNQVIEKHIRPFLFRDYGDIECLFIDGTMIVVNYLGACAGCTKSLTSTMDYIQEVLRKELSEPGILVVTDS